jgi:hypothetical protein
MSLSQSHSLQRLPRMSFSKVNGGMARYGKAQLEEEMAARAQLERRAAVAQAAQLELARFPAKASAVTAHLE